MDAKFKAERYAMIRRAALKIQKQRLAKERGYKLVKKYAKAIDRLDDQSPMHWNDTDRYLSTHYGDRVTGENYD